MPEAGVVFAQDLIQKVNHLFHNRSSLRLSIIPSSFRFHCGHAGVVSLGSLRLFSSSRSCIVFNIFFIRAPPYLHFAFALLEEVPLTSSLPIC